MFRQIPKAKTTAKLLKHNTAMNPNKRRNPDFKTAHSTVYLLCASALANSESALLNLKRFKLISAFPSPFTTTFRSSASC